jgi:hypothetical protein
MSRRLLHAGVDRRFAMISIIVSCFIRVLWSILIVIALVISESFYLKKITYHERQTDSDLESANTDVLFLDLYLNTEFVTRYLPNKKDGLLRL